MLKANSLETKQLWVKRMREVMQETYFSGTSFSLLKSPAKVSGKNLGQRLSKDIDDTLNDNDQDGSSLASFGSGNTTDSEKVSETKALRNGRKKFGVYLLAYRFGVYLLAIHLHNRDEA